MRSFGRSNTSSSPGKKYHIITFGCQMNKSDSERIAAVLERTGYRPTSDTSKADLIVVNMCSVRQSAVDRIYGLVPKFKKLKEKNPALKTILTGCILKEDKKKLEKSFNLVLSIKTLPCWQNLLHWPNLLQKETIPKLLPWQKESDSSYFKIRPKHGSNFLAYIPISNGCNNFCSYCVVPLVRGPLVCRDPKEILEEVKNLDQKGFKEIWLLGQNVNDYLSEQKTGNKKQKINFAKLIKMVDEVPGDFRFFFTSPHPKNFSDELINTLAKCKKFGKYLNLPVQSGDDEILKKMNRSYTVDQYQNLVKKIREKIPEINLSTDVIVGFPGETKKQFENTVKLFKEIKFNNAYIAKYSPRPGTAAAKMEDNTPYQEKKRRWQILMEILKQTALEKTKNILEKKLKF